MSPLLLNIFTPADYFNLPLTLTMPFLFLVGGSEVGRIGALQDVEARVHSKLESCTYRATHAPGPAGKPPPGLSNIWQGAVCRASLASTHS
jgi:hypothetical protein